MELQLNSYGAGEDLDNMEDDSITGKSTLAIEDDFTSALGVVKGDTWRYATPESRAASVDDAFTIIVDEAEKDKSRKVPWQLKNGEATKDAPLFFADGSWSPMGKEWLQQQRQYLEAAAQDESGGFEYNPLSEEFEAASHLAPLLKRQVKQHDPFEKFSSLKTEIESEVIDGKPREFTYEAFLERANEGKDPNSPSAIDPDNEQMRERFESRKKLEAYDPNSMGDKPFDIVEGVPIFNAKMLHRPSDIEKSIEDSSLSTADKKMALINFKDTYNKLGSDIVTNLSDADDMQMHKSIFNMLGDIVGYDRNNISKRFEEHMAEGKGSIYNFIKENEEEFSGEQFGWADKLNNAFWNANRSTLTGAAWLLTAGQSDTVTGWSSASARSNDSAFEGMGGVEHYRVLGMDFTNKGMYDMAGQVSSFLAMAGGGLLVKGAIGVTNLTLRAFGIAAAKATGGAVGGIAGGKIGYEVGDAIGGDLGGKIGGVAGGIIGGGAGYGGVGSLKGTGLRTAAAREVLKSDDAMLAAAKELAPNTAKNLVIKALRDPSAYIGGLQAAGMSHGATFNQVMEQTGDYEMATKKANIAGIASGAAAFVATSVFNRIAPGAEKMLTGVEGSLGGSLIARLQYAKAAGAASAKANVVEVLENVTKDKAMREALANGLAESVDLGAKRAGLKGFGPAGGMVSEFFEEAVDTALNDVFTAMLDDSVTWTDSVWDNIGEKFSEYMAAGVMGAFGGAMGESVGGLTSFSKANQKQRVEAIKRHSDVVWQNIKGNVASFDANTLQTASDAGVDRTIVSWAEYLANSPDDPKTKAKKFAEQIMSGAYTADYTSAMEDDVDMPKAAAKADAEQSSTNNVEAPPVDAEDEGAATLAKMGVSAPEGKTITSGLTVQRDDNPIKVGKVGTMVPMMVGTVPNAAAEWTPAGGKPEVISAEKAAAILSQNIPTFGGGKLRAQAESFTKSQSRYEQAIQNEWTTKQSNASNANNSSSEAASQARAGNSAETQEISDSGVAGNGRVEPPSGDKPSASTPAALTPSGNAKFNKAFPVERVEYDDASHTYKVDGKELPSVTTKLGKHKAFSFDGKSKAGEEAAATGSAYHAKIEKELAGEDTDLHPTIKALVAKLKKMAKGPIVSEKVVFTNGYAGTIDLLVELKDGTFAIVDFKTTQLAKLKDYRKPFKAGKEAKSLSHEVQLKAYIEALKANGIVASKAFIGHIPVDAQETSRLEEVQISEKADTYYEEIFGKAEKKELAQTKEPKAVEVKAEPEPETKQIDEEQTEIDNEDETKDEELQVEDTEPAPTPEMPRETSALKASMQALQDSNEEQLLDIIREGRSSKDQRSAMRYDAARRILFNMNGVDPVEQLAYTVLDAAAPTATKGQKVAPEITTFTVDRNMAMGGTDSLGGTWSTVKTSSGKPPSAFYYTPPKGQKMRGNPSVLSFTDTQNEVLVLAGIDNGRYMFKRIDLTQALENQAKTAQNSNGLEQPNFDRASKEWESTRLTKSNTAVIASLSKILGSSTVNQADFNKVFNAVLRIVAPNVNPKDIVFTKLPGDSFIRTEGSAKGAKVVVDKDKMVGHLRYLFDGYASGRGDFYDTMVANEMARQLSAWIDEEQIHRIALPLFSQDELKTFFDEALAAEGDAKSIRNLLLETVRERLGEGFNTEEASSEQIKMLVHETLRKMHQLISTGSNTEMQTDTARSIMSILNEGVAPKGAFNKIKTVMAMMRRYFQRVKNALYMRRLHKKMTGHQQNMLNRLMSAYSKDNLQGDVDMISQKSAGHAAWIYQSYKKDFETRTNDLIMSEDLSDALTALKDIPKRFVNANMDDLVDLDSKTGKLTLSPIARGLAEDGWINAPVDAIEKALNFLSEQGTGFGALSQWVMAQQALEAARFNVDDVSGLDFDSPTSKAVWDALESGIRASGDVTHLAAIQNYYGEQIEEVEKTYRQELTKLDLEVIHKVRDADVNTREGLKTLIEIANKVGFPVDYNSDEYSRLIANSMGDGTIEWDARFGPERGSDAKNERDNWRRYLLSRLIVEMNSSLAEETGRQGSLAEMIQPLVTAKITSDATAKKVKIASKQKNAEDRYQAKIQDLPNVEPIDEQTQDKYIRYVSYLVALDEYNKAARNVVQRAIGEFDFRNKDHGLSFRDVTSPISQPAPTYGFEDVSEDMLSQVNGYLYVTASQMAAMTAEEKAQFFGGGARPSRQATPELYSAVSSNAGHQGKVMFERFHILQSQGVVPMSDVYALTGGFNIPIETSESGGSKAPEAGAVFYRWKVDAAFDIYRKYIGEDFKNKSIPSPKEVMEAIGFDRDSSKPSNTYIEHLNETEEWLDKMEELIDPDLIVSEINGNQTLAGRQAILLSKRLKEARAAFEDHHAEVLALYVKAKTGAANVGQEFEGIIGSNNLTTKTFREAMWNASADVMMARTAYRSFMDPQWRANRRREASRTTRDVGFRPNKEYVELRERPIDLPTYINYSFFLNFLSQRKSEYFVSPVYGSHLLKNLEKGNWSNDSYEMWKESNTKWIAVAQRDEAGNPIKGADGETVMTWAQVTDKTGDEGLVFPQSQLDNDGRPLMPPSMMETSPYEEDTTRAKAERNKDLPDMIRRRWFTQTALLIGMRMRSDKKRELGKSDTEQAQQFFHDISSLGEGSDVAEIVRQGIGGLFGIYDAKYNMREGPILERLVSEFNDRYPLPTEDDGQDATGYILRKGKAMQIDPIELLVNMVRFKAEKEQALLDQARIKDPDLAAEVLVTLVAEATAGGRNQDMLGKSARPSMSGNSYTETPIVGEPITQEVDETYEERVPNLDSPFDGDTIKVKKTRKKTITTGNKGVEGEFQEYDKAFQEKNKRSLFDTSESAPNAFISEDEIAEITRQFRRDMMVTSGEIPVFRASVLKEDGGEHPFVSSNRAVNLVLQSLPGDVVIYAPQRSVYVNGSEVKTRVIPARNGGPTVLYVRAGSNTGRDEAAALLASALSIHANNTPAIKQAILDFARDGMEKISVMRSVERINKMTGYQAKLYQYASKKLGDKMLGGQKVDKLLRDSIQVAVRDHMVRLGEHARIRGSLSEASIYDQNGQQTIGSSIVFVSELMTNPKLKELYDLLTPEDGLTNVPDTGLSADALMEILQAVEDVTRSELTDQDNEAAQYEQDLLNESSIEYNEEDFMQEGDDPALFDDNLGLELEEAAEADPDASDILAASLANLGKESGDETITDAVIADAVKTGLVESKRKIDALFRRAFRDKSIHLQLSPTLVSLTKQAREFGNTNLHRSDAEIINFFSQLLIQANEKVTPFESRSKQDYSLNSRKERLAVMSKIAGDSGTYGAALARAVLPSTNRGGAYYGGSWDNLLRPNNPSRSSLMTTAMNHKRHGNLRAGLIAEVLDVTALMNQMRDKREEEINDSWERASENKRGLAGYGENDLYIETSNSLLAQLGHVLPGTWETVDGVKLNRIQLAAMEQQRVINSIFERRDESRKKLAEALIERGKLEDFVSRDEDFDVSFMDGDDEATVTQIVDQLSAALDDVVRSRVLARRSRAESVAATFKRLSANTFWEGRRMELQSEIVAVAKGFGAYQRSEEKGDMPISVKASASWANHLIDRFEQEVNDSLEYILKVHYGVAPLSQEGNRRKLFEMDRVDTVNFSNLGTITQDVNSVFNTDALSRQIGVSMASLEKGVIGEEFVDVLLSEVQEAEQKVSGNKEKAKRLSSGKQSKPRQGDSLNTNAKKELDSLLLDLQERFGNNPDRSQAKAYIRRIVEQGFSREDSLDLPADVVQDNQLLSSAIRALIPSKEMRMKMLTDNGKLSVEVRDKIESTHKQESVAQRELKQAEDAISMLVAQSVLPHNVGWTKRSSDRRDDKGQLVKDRAGHVPEMSFTLNLSPPGLVITSDMTRVQIAKAKKDFAMAKSAEMLAQIENGEKPDFSFIARANAIMRETGQVARHEMDDTYKLLKADSQYFNDFNPQQLIQNTMELVKAEKGMIQARIQQARDIANEVKPTGGLNSLGVDALTMLADPANGVQIVSVNAQKRVSTWTSPSNWQARRDLLGRLVNDEGQWVVMAPTTAREDLAKRYADTGRKKITFENFVLDAIMAHHGTRHKIVGGFSNNNIGTGEGAQAYGYGHYSTSDEFRVAIDYQIAGLSPGDSPYARARSVETNFGPNALDWAKKKLIEAQSDYDKFRLSNPLTSSTASINNEARKLAAIVRNAVDLVKIIDTPLKRRAMPGNRYSLELDMDDSNLLDWNAELKDQPAIIQNAFREFGIINPNQRGEWSYKELAADHSFSGYKGASAMLRERGVKGIKYIGEFERTNGEGTLNYVAFDAKDIKVTHENGKPIISEEKNTILDALAPTLTGKDYEGNSVSRINFSAAYLDDVTELDLPVVVNGKVTTTKGMSRREAAKLIEKEYRLNTVSLIEQSAQKDGHKINDASFTAEALDRFSYMVRAMVYAHNHQGLTPEVKETLNEWLRKLQDSSKGDNHFKNILTVQQMNTIEMFSEVFADIEGNYIMDTLASGLALDPQAHSLTMMKYLHHEDGRTRGRFIRSYVAMQEAMRIRSLLDRGFDDNSGRIGAKVQHQRASASLVETQKALGNDAFVQSKAYVHASLQGLIETRSGTLSGNLQRWIEDFERGVFYLDGLNEAQNVKFKSAGSRFFKAQHVDLLRDTQMVKDMSALLKRSMDAYSKNSSDLTFESREAQAKNIIADMQNELTKAEKKDEIKAHSAKLVELFNELTDAMQITKTLMSQPETTPEAIDEYNPLYNKGKKPNVFFNTTVPLRFHYASNPLESEIDKASFEEGKRIEDPIDIVKLEESTLLGGIGRHEDTKGKSPYRPINLNGLSAIDSMLEDAFYRLNVTPAYTVLRKVMGREEPTNKGITMISEDAKILRTINQTKDWKYEHRAKRVSLAAVARELENVIANDSQIGTYNTHFSEAIRFLSSVFTVKALFSVLQLWNQTAPASTMVVVKKLLTGDIQGAKDFALIAARMSSSGIMGNIKGVIQTADEKSKSSYFFKDVDDWVKGVDPWISFRGTDGMDPYRNVLRNQRRHGVNAVKSVAGKLTKQLEALNEWGLDKTIGVGERWISRSIYMMELLGELRRMKEAGVIDVAPETVDQLLEIPGHLIPTQAKDYARIKVNDMMGMADQSKKSFMFQSHSRFPGIQALTRSAVRFSNHTATTASNMTSLIPAIRRLGDDASYGEQRMRREAVENVIGTLGQNTLFHLMKLHTLVPLVAYIIFNVTGDDDDEAQEKAQALADGMLAPSEEMDKTSDFLKAATFGKENQFFQDWRDPESARKSAYANLLGKVFTEFSQTIPGFGVALGYMPVNSLSKNITDPIAEHLMAIGDDMEVARGNMAEQGIRIYERERGPLEGLAQLTAPSAELYNLFDAGRTGVESLFLEDSNPLETALYMATEVFATRELRGALEGRIKKRIRESEE